MASRVRLDDHALRRLLDSEDGPVGKTLLRSVTRIEGDAKRLCPVDTGRLRASITHAIDHDPRGLVGVVGTDVDYAPHVELGTTHAGAQPFLRPALASEVGRARR